MSNLIDGYIPAACVYGAFALVYMLNILFGVVTNCIVDGQTFDGKKLLNSFLKITLVGATMVGIVVAFNLLIIGIEQFNVEIKEMVVSVISLGTFILLFIKGFVQTAIDVYNKIKALFEINDKTEFYTTDLMGFQYTTPDDIVNHEV